MAAPAPAAHAHANLLQSTPEANARLDRAPVLVELFFSEPIEAGFSAIQVLDTSGKRVDNDDATVDPGNPIRLTVTLRSLPAGIYTVSWRTLSSVDSHVTTGAFPFAVGNVDNAALAAAQANDQLDFAPGEAAARWLTYLAAMTLAGGALFVLLVWRPVVGERLLVISDRGLGIRNRRSGKAGHQIPNTQYPIPDTQSQLPNPEYRLLNTSALFILLLAGIFWLLVQAGQISGDGLAWPWQASVTRVLFMTRFGALWAGRLLLALLMLWLLPRLASRRNIWLVALAGWLMLLSLSLGSHAAAKPEPILPTLADWVHQYDAFANFNVSVGVNTAVSTVPWHRFSGGLLAAAGAALLFTLPSLLAAKWRSGYGRLLALPLILVGTAAFVRPPIVDKNPILPNPIPPNADSIADGEALYLKNCVPCHGLSGAGDGPVGLSLNPPPADLTQHTVPGVHPDGRLYNWISSGVEGSIMPAFDKTLSDEERWHIVNYIRTLSKSAH